MKLLLYCTKAKPYLFESINEKGKYMLENDEWFKELNGKIVAECDFDVEEIEYDWYPCDILPIGEHYYTYYHTKSISTAKEFYSKSCLDWDKLNQYLNDYDSQKFEGGYAIHIKNLHIFDKPRELNEFMEKRCQYAICSTCRYGKDNIKCATIDNEIDKAPQNMMYAYDNDGKRYVLISIRPEWLCKILNREKTIEVRKKVLKEVLE